MDFKQAENKFKELKAQFEGGELSETGFKTQLEALMVQDEAGTWWMIGYETEKWYRSDGDDWVQAEPPVLPTRESAQTANWAEIFSITLAWIIAGAIAGRINWEIGYVLGSAVAGGFAWGTGGLISMLVFYREQIGSRWNRIGMIALVWAAGGAFGWALGEVLTEASGGAIGAAAGGALGGAFTLQNVHALIDWKKLLWITLAWAVAMAIGWSIGHSIQAAYDGAVGWPLGRGIACGIGGSVTIWQLKKK
jgi:hypothetical protein